MKSVLRSGSTPAEIQSATLSIAFDGDGRRVGVIAGQRVPVGHEVEAVVLLLQRRPVLERANEVAEMELSSRPHARNDSSFEPSEEKGEQRTGHSGQ